jgi:peptide/nickel transport system substrate-binding protein
MNATSTRWASTRKATLATSLALGAVLLAGCLGDPSATARDLYAYDPLADPITNPDVLFDPFPFDDPGRADTEATITRYALDQPTSLNPMFLNSWAGGFLHELLFDFLTYPDGTMEATWNEAMVAEVEALEGGRIHRVHLHPELRWHDGQPLTSEDVLFSYEAIGDDGVPAASFKYKVAEIDTIRVIDERTLDVVHKEVSALALNNLSFPILPRHLLDDPQERAADPTMRSSPFFNLYGRERVIGNGPYRFVEWITGDRVVVERWDDYPGEKPPIRRQIIATHSDRNAALLQFRKGILDDIWLTVQQHGSQTTDEAFSALGVKAWAPRWMHAYIGWNQDGSNPFFADRRVRRALAHAYNRERVLRTVSWNVYTASNGMFGPSHWAHNPNVELIEYDLENAAALLDEAGWVVDEDDGWRYKTIGAPEGEKVRFHFTMNLPQSFVDARRMIDIYRDDLRRIGVSFDTLIEENAAREQRMRNHELTSHVDTYQVFADPDVWRNYFHTDSIKNGRNYDGYSNSRVDELFDRSRLELDRERRTEMLQELQRLIQEDQPALFLWNYSTTWAFSQRIRGVELSPAGVVRFGPGARRWWVEKAR